MPPDGLLLENRKQFAQQPKRRLVRAAQDTARTSGRAFVRTMLVGFGGPGPMDDHPKP